MANRKPLTGQRLKETRSALAALKRAGLYSGDAKRAKGGWRQQALIKRYADVVSGKAKAVKVGKAASGFDTAFRAKAGRVVVKVAKGERVKYSSKTGTLSSVLTEYGVKFRRVIPRKTVVNFDDLPHKPRKGKVFLYRLPHNPLMDMDGMREMFVRYKDKKGFAQSIEVLEYDAEMFPVGEYEDD